VSEHQRTDTAREADAAARRRAQLVFDRPLVIEAGAGTGKTTVLVSRIVAWCLGEGWERAARLRGERAAEPTSAAVAGRVLEGVVAITFTEAAAAEMEHRVAQTLGAIARGQSAPGLVEAALPAPPASRERARALLGEFDRLRVSTIHAFCRRLLAEFPLEAGLHPHFEVDARGLARLAVAREVVEESLRGTAVAEGDADWTELLVRGVDARRVEEILVALLERGVPATAFGADPCDGGRVRAFAERLRQALDELVEAVGGGLDGFSTRTRAAGIRRALADSTALLGRSIPETTVDLAALIESLRALWTSSLLAHLRVWSRGEGGEQERAAFEGRWHAVQPAAEKLLPVIRHAVGLDPALLVRLHRVVAALLERAERRLYARGAVCFDALLRHARDLLRDHPAVAARVRDRIEQLLVDEFQDTDHLQCEVVVQLALEGPAADRPGLFVVGDPKQSIYGWRNAELRAYERFLGRVAREPGAELHVLAVNHRSVPAVLDEVARAIGPVMQRIPEVQPAFETLLPSEEQAAAAGSGPTGVPPVEYWVSALWDAEAGALARTRSAEATDLEAEHLARDLVALHEQHGVAWRGVAVLVRGTGDLDRYLEVLRRSEIPYSVDRDRAYYRRREVLDAAALVRAVLDPSDQIALVTVLRSAWVGLPDAAWRPLWELGFPERLRRVLDGDGTALAALHRILPRVAASLRGAEVPGIDRLGGWELALAHAIDVLATLQRAFREQAIDRFVEALRTLSLIEATEAARHLGRYRVANLERFFRELGEALEVADGDAAAVLRALRRNALSEPEVDPGRPRDPAEDAVQILTIHRAKGLDFEHVYLVQTHKGSGGRDDEPAAVDEIDGALEYRLGPVTTLGYDAARVRREEIEQAELLRTLYVALTRARRRLVVAGRMRSLRSGVRPATHAELLARSRGTACAEALSRVGSGGHRVAVEHDGVRWIFLGRRRRRALARRRRASAPATPAERVRRDSKRLRACRAEADRRARRALGGIASERTPPWRGETAAADGDSILAEAPGLDAGRVGAAVGTAVHRLLEHFDWAAPRAAEWARQRDRLRRELGGTLPVQHRDRALDRVDRLLDRVASGPLFGRLEALQSQVLARELPVLAQPGSEAEGPVAYVAGQIDLVYRDPDDGCVAIVDFKTDRIRTAADLRRKTERYRGQAAVYTLAVREGLDLPEAPRFELWFLDVSEIVCFR
jgi:ATP-dependent exoDNAse (exonuclease V) beta subunit